MQDVGVMLFLAISWGGSYLLGTIGLRWVSEVWTYPGWKKHTVGTRLTINLLQVLLTFCCSIAWGIRCGDIYKWLMT